MLYLLGVVAFALGILISVSLHEAGHMLTAKWFGMKVSRYFVGFGPTLWSFRRGETEYGLKAIPLGGFCKIVGMTPQDDDVDPEDEPRAMWRFPVWKRTIVMGAGAVIHFALAIITLWFAAIFMGLPNPDYPDPTDSAQVRAEPARITLVECVVPENVARACRPDDPVSPAVTAQLRDGDLVTAINGTQVATWGQMLDTIRALPPGPALITYVRDGATRTAQVNLASVQRAPQDQPDGPAKPVSAMGVGLGTPGLIKYDPLAAFGATADYTGTMAVNTVHALKRIPEKVPALWAAITGEERDVDTPISVVGASRLGGEAIQHGLWELFVMLFVSLNFFVGVFQLLPLLPLDGGHIAIAWFERVRSWLFARFNRPDPGRVDYLKLMPFTYVVILVGGAFTLLTITADVVNPITLISK